MNFEFFHIITIIEKLNTYISKKENDFYISLTIKHMKEKLNSLTWLLVAVSITIFFFNIFSYDPKNGYDGDAL